MSVSEEWFRGTPLTWTHRALALLFPPPAAEWLLWRRAVRVERGIVGGGMV